MRATPCLGAGNHDRPRGSGCPLWFTSAACATLGGMAFPLRIAAAGLLGLAVGLVVGLRWTATRAPADLALPAEPAADPQLAALRGDLEQERERRRSLEQELAALRESLAQAEALAKTEGGPEPGDPAATETPEDAEDDPGFDPQALADLGWSAAAVRRLQERHERLELDRLYLRDQARREGWLHRRRHQRELAALRQATLDELGEEDYDAMLYAAGRNNRVIVTRSLANSPAEAAGLRAGDALLSYDGQRIFDPTTIVQATASGVAGTPTELRFERGGEEMRIFLPRGPLGIHLRRGRRPPDVR